MADCTPITTPSAQLIDRKSTRLNSSHTVISYAVFCLKKKKKTKKEITLTEKRQSTKYSAAGHLLKYLNDQNVTDNPSPVSLPPGRSHVVTEDYRGCAS